jgi:hypothetical protein
MELPVTEKINIPPSDNPLPADARPGRDLSNEIESVVDREAGDEVRCARVGDDTYRCNWWCMAVTSGYDNPAMKGGQLATDHRIRKSQFLRVTEGRQGLNITELPQG